MNNIQQQQPRRTGKGRKNTRSYIPVPMMNQPAILPRIGQLLDRLQSLFTNEGKSRFVARILGRVLYWSSWPLRMLYRRYAPYNMFWPTMTVARNLEATIYIIYDQPEEEGKVRSPVDCMVWVAGGNPDHLHIWRHGAYGKGILSRSSPTWAKRYIQSMEVNDEEVVDGEGERKKKTFLEDITILRRQERLLAKQEDARDDVDDGLVLECSSMCDLEISAENEQVIENMEPVQLSYFETLFLSQLESLVVRNASTGQTYNYYELYKMFVQLQSDKKGDSREFMNRYAAYYYYRSKGWVVKSGLKFGSDFLLYERGPSQSHARYSIIVEPQHHDKSCERRTESWQFMSALIRTTVQVQKILILCYVDSSSHNDYTKVPDLSTFDIEEFSIRRFAPSSNRK